MPKSPIKKKAPAKKKSIGKKIVSTLKATKKITKAKQVFVVNKEGFIKKGKLKPTVKKHEKVELSDLLPEYVLAPDNNEETTANPDGISYDHLHEVNQPAESIPDYETSVAFQPDENTPQIVLNIKNVSRTEKRVTLFDKNYIDREILITNAFFGSLSYEQMIDMVNAGSYKIGGIYVVINRGAQTGISYLNMRYKACSLTGIDFSFPIELCVTPIQAQENIVYNPTPTNKDVILDAGGTIDLNIQSDSEIVVRLYLSETYH